MAAQGQTFFSGVRRQFHLVVEGKRGLAGGRCLCRFRRRHGPDHHESGRPLGIGDGVADSGGGISPDKIAIPSWQQLSGVINSSNKGSTTYRNGPDVSANANFTFYVCADQKACLANEYGGTSFAAPMWAGFIALVNQQLAANGDPTVGFINPTIYAQNITSELCHGLPRHHQRHIRQLFGGDRLRSGDRLGQSETSIDHNPGSIRSGNSLTQPTQKKTKEARTFELGLLCALAPSMG